MFHREQAKDEEEEKREQDEKDKELVKQKHAEHGDDARQDGGVFEAGDDEQKDKMEMPSAFDKDLPGEGKQIEDMTEDERLERGVALVQRAFERGWKQADPME